MDEDQGQLPESLLPYEEWTEDAFRQVMARALAHVAAHGLPGQHHFFITFRTDQPGVAIPTRLLAQYPEEMTNVLQHQFWDLRVTESGFSVGLSFGGVPTTLTIPYRAVIGFADPQVRYGIRFRLTEPAAATESEASPAEAAAEPAERRDLAPIVASPAGEAGPAAEEESVPAEPQVVSLDAFRRRSAPKE